MPPRSPSVRPAAFASPVSGRTPLAQIKLLNSDPAALEGQVETIKKKYEEYFGT